jgi:DNA-directed RNA polymerase subunit F
MVKGKTKKGFFFKIQEEAMDDWELVEELVEIDKGDTTKIINVAKKLLGEKQYENLKNFLRDKASGRVKATDMMNTVLEILEKVKEGKN